MMLKKFTRIKKLLFISLSLGLLHIILGLLSLLYFYTSTFKEVPQLKVNSEIIDQINKETYNVKDLKLFANAEIISDELTVNELPNKQQLYEMAQKAQAEQIIKAQSHIKELQLQKQLALKVLLVSLGFSILFGWVIPSFIVKKITSLLINFKNEIQKNIEEMVLNWKSANLKDNQAAYLLLSLQALSLYLSLRGEKLTTEILNEISKNLSRIFNTDESHKGI